jgi:hypothetical protein
VAARSVGLDRSTINGEEITNVAASGAESDQTQEDFLNGILALWTADELELSIQLFTNNEVPTNASITTDFDVATFAGGDALDLSVADFGAAVVAAHVATSTGPLCTWINSSGAAVDVWGYVVFETVSEDFRWAENFGTAQTVANGGAFTVQPALKQESTYF